MRRRRRIFGTKTEHSRRISEQRIRQNTDILFIRFHVSTRIHPAVFLYPEAESYILYWLQHDADTPHAQIPGSVFPHTVPFYIGKTRRQISVLERYCGIALHRAVPFGGFTYTQNRTICAGGKDSAEKTLKILKLYLKGCPRGGLFSANSF